MGKISPTSKTVNLLQAMSKNNNADMLCFAKYECPLKGTERDYVKASYIQQSKYN